MDDSDSLMYYCTNSVNQYDATAAAAGCDPATEEFGYDDDGNLIADGKATSDCETADGTMTYVWNGENRLAEAFPTSPAAGDVKVRFAYDYMGRRVRKEVLAWDDGAGDWAATPTTDLKFVYDGWNVVQVLDGTTAGDPVTQQYTWGFDLSGTLGGAGGIGGLLAVEETATTGEPAYWYFYDGNSNVGQVIAADGQSAVAKYEYDSYGNLIVSSGTYADANPFRFSTKWLDVVTGMYYHGYRYYDPRFGRWTSRDPIEEEGGLNLLVFCRNSPNNEIDPLGQVSFDTSVFIDFTRRGSIATTIRVRLRPPASVCCRLVRFAQIVFETRFYAFGGVSSGWSLDNGSRIGPPLGRVWYPHVDRQLGQPDGFGRRGVHWVLSDNPGLSAFSGPMFAGFSQEFETCAVCVHGSASITRGCVLGCVKWGHWWMSGNPDVHKCWGTNAPVSGPSLHMAPVLRRISTGYFPIDMRCGFLAQQAF